jgi:hypothetical protein
VTLSAPQLCSSCHPPSHPQNSHDFPSFLRIKRFNRNESNETWTADRTGGSRLPVALQFSLIRSRAGYSNQ